MSGHIVIKICDVTKLQYSYNLVSMSQAKASKCPICKIIFKILLPQREH